MVAYILLEKWSEATKKRERISLLVELAAEEADRAEAMGIAYVVHSFFFTYFIYFFATKIYVRCSFP